jgi:hypothetical protein
MRLFSKSSGRPALLPRAQEQLSHSVDGDTARLKHRATHGAACHPAVHNVDSSFSQHRPAQYAQAKRWTLNQNPEESGEEGLDHVGGIGYQHMHSEPQGINLSEPEICRRMGSTPVYR